MFSKNNIQFPSKSHYSLKEACQELNIYFNRTDINENYLLDIIYQGYINLYAKIALDKHGVIIPYDWEMKNKEPKETLAFREIVFFNSIIRRFLRWQNDENNIFYQIPIDYAEDLKKIK